MNAKIKKADRRTARTKTALHQALIHLILEKHFDLITVQDIIDRANVGRSTFYAHFRDKEDLLMGDWEKFLDAFVRHIDWEKTKTGRFVPIRELFLHVRDFHPFYRALVRSSKMERLYKTGLGFLSASLERSLTDFLKERPRPSITLPILVNHLASAMFEQLKWWLDHNMPYPPERMDEIFHELVASNFQFFTEESETSET